MCVEDCSIYYEKLGKQNPIFFRKWNGFLDPIEMTIAGFDFKGMDDAT